MKTPCIVGYREDHVVAVVFPDQGYEETFAFGVKPEEIGLVYFGKGVQKGPNELFVSFD